MATTITLIYPDSAEITTTPELVDGYSARRATGNVIIPILGGGIAVVVRPAQPRSGTLRLFYPDEADAAAAAEMHTFMGTFTLTSDERESIEMTYVVSGQITVDLDDETRDLWVVSVDYQELS